MSNQQAFLNGFVKRAAQYGYSQKQAVEIMKTASMYRTDAPDFPYGSVNLPNSQSIAAEDMGDPNTLEQFKTEDNDFFSRGEEMPQTVNYGQAGGPQSIPTTTQPAQPISQNTMPPQPVQPINSVPQASGPSDAFLAKVMGSYNPKSKADQAQASRVRELYAQGKTTPNAIYADPRYRINREALGARKGSNASAYGKL